MTTNARDEKWSSWIDWSGGECPLSTDAKCEVKFRLENMCHVESKPETLDWNHYKSGGDIIAYRYKIKEPESDMHPDLKWLAENVSEWPQVGAERSTIFARRWENRSTQDEQPSHIAPWAGTDRWFTFDQWLQARKDLGIVMSDSEEELPAEEWAGSVPEGAEAEGRKYDNDKPAMDLIPPYMEEEVGMVLAFGAHKYAPDNWRKVTPLRSRYLAAAQRHINALKKGEQMDPESGLHHAAHAVCCLMFLGEVELERTK